MADGSHVPSSETLERLHDIEDDIRKLTANVTELTATVSAQAANIRTITDQLGSVFSRINQPTNWAVVIAAMVLLITGADLKVTPIEADVQRLRATSLRIEDRMLAFQLKSSEQHGREAARNDALEKMLSQITKDYYSEHMERALHSKEK